MRSDCPSSRVEFGTKPVCDIALPRSVANGAKQFVAQRSKPFKSSCEFIVIDHHQLGDKVVEVHRQRGHRNLPVSDVEQFAHVQTGFDTS